MSIDSGCMLLAESEDGHLKMCAVGCTHLTFGMVSLHFSSADDFEGLVESVAYKCGQSDASRGVTISYNYMSLMLNRESFGSLLALLRDAVQTVRWFRGDFKLSLTDETAMGLRQDRDGGRPL